MPSAGSSTREFALASSSSVLWLALAAAAPGAADSAPVAPAVAAPDWQGLWEGTLVNIPGRLNAPPVTIKRQIGAWPAENGTCTTFSSSYFENAKQAGVKDYKLCRGTSETDLYIDEGDTPEGKDIILPTRLFGDTLVSVFKYRNILLTVSTRVVDGVMTEDIVSTPDVAATDDVVQMPSRSLQRLTFRRVPSAASVEARAGATVVLPGLQYQVVRSGPSDGEHPRMSGTVTVHYEGKLPNGEIFDSSFQRGTPATFKGREVIPGWQVALRLMRPGDEWIVTIPPELAYGAKGAGPIPPNSPLIFRMQLISATPPPVTP